MKYILILFCFGLCVSSCSAQRDSLQKNFNSRGQLISEGSKIHGMLEGEWKYYDDSLGYLKKIITYRHGLYHGPYKEFYPNGKSKKQGYYDRNFIRKEIDENGFEFKYALPIGTWDYYNETGGLIKSEVYDCSGKIIQTLPEK